jgi:hypothetical protein
MVPVVREVVDEPHAGSVQKGGVQVEKLHVLYIYIYIYSY